LPNFNNQSKFFLSAGMWDGVFARSLLNIFGGTIIAEAVVPGQGFEALNFFFFTHLAFISSSPPPPR
jgi:hypothetical protein